MTGTEAGSGRSDDDASIATGISLSLEKKLRGHSSTVTFIALLVFYPLLIIIPFEQVRHLDWSADGRLLQSSSGAHELLCWDVSRKIVKVVTTSFFLIICFCITLTTLSLY